jgi:hypothetical protein
MRLIAVDETRMLFRDTESEFTIVVREAMVNPPGRWKFA